MKKIITIGLLTFGALFSILFFTKRSYADTNSQHSNNKYVYITFDDGPLNGSRRISDAILREEIPITVLLVGEHALERPEDVKLYKENKYISIGNHSYTHANNHYKLYYSNPNSVLKDFIRNMDTLRLNNKIARLPGRNMWRIDGKNKNDISSGIQAADLLSKNGFSIFGWDLEWHHDPHTAEPIGTAEDIFKQMEKILNDNTSFTKSHIVLLCHDEMFRTSYDESELKRLINLLKTKSDYKFASLKDYL